MDWSKISQRRPAGSVHRLPTKTLRSAGKSLAWASITNLGLDQVSPSSSLVANTKNAFGLSPPATQQAHSRPPDVRSIPIVIALNEEYDEVGHWGPRPTELQSWVMTNRQTIPKSELYPQVRRWYARDRGESTLREVLAATGFPAAKVA